MGSGGKLHSFLTSVLDGNEWSASNLCRLTPGGSPRYPLNRRPDEPQNGSGHFAEEKIVLPLWELSLDSLVVQTVV